VYSILRLADPVTAMTGPAPSLTCTISPEQELPHVDLGLTYPGDDYLSPAPVAVTGVPNPRPRPTRILDGEAYRQAAADVLADAGVDDPDPDVIQVVAGDLEGDGTDEVLVVTERLARGDLYGQTGDYSLLFLRQVVDGAVRTTVLDQGIVPSDTPTEEVSAIGISRVAALADLNGDGRMELVTEHRYYEGGSHQVYELGPDGVLKSVLVAGCGV
jgi:hypothetical protein